MSAQTVGTVVVAHGGDSVWNAAVLRQAGDVRTGGPVGVALLMGPAAPAHRFQDVVDTLRAEAVQRIREVITFQSQLTGRPVVVVPLLIARGEVSATKVPADLARLSVIYGGAALTPHPQLARWVERRVKEAGSQPR